MTEFGPPEPVQVENDWYDGPRAGIASIGGQPHRFLRQFDDDEDDWLDTYLVWPIGEDELALEQRQWRIFVRWNDAYEAGRVDIDTHPGKPGTDARWDALAALLEPCREEAPATARRAKARMTSIERAQRYAPDGPGYLLAWQLL